jgi:peroxiredoxin
MSGTTTLLAVAAIVLSLAVAGCGPSGEPTGPEMQPDPAPGGDSAAGTPEDPPAKPASAEEFRAAMRAGDTTLGGQLAAMVNNFESRRPEVATIYNQGITDVAESGVLDTALKVGDTAPDFTLPAADGAQVSLAELREAGPVVLIWYRGGWCPYCNMQLIAMQESLADIRAAGASVVAISPEKPDKAAETQSGAQADFAVVSDVGLKVASDFGIAYELPDAVWAQFDGRLDLAGHNGEAHKRNLPLGATYIVGRDGKILFAHVGADYRERAEPADIVAALKSAE